MVSRKASQNAQYVQLEVDGLQQQMLGSTSVGQEQKAEVAVGTGSPNLDS